MLRTLSLLNQNCRCAARLISQQPERELTKLEATGLFIHLAGCANCRRYRRQVRMLNQLVTADTAASAARLSESARARIAGELSRLDNSSTG